jgi:UDP-N-acetylglucosamine 2-epimerase
MKILTIVGARPQYIKAAPVSNVLKEAGLEEIMVNTGQHYDFNMSDIFFKELNIPSAKYNLNVRSDTHGRQTGKMLTKLDEIIENEKPDAAIVYGDTNTTLAGALSCVKQHIPVIHIEAGLRSYNKKMPEEINRVVTDHISSMLFCPSEVSAENLKNESIRDGVHVVGDVMNDIFQKFKTKFGDHNEYGDYALLTMHRAENTEKEILTKRLLQMSELNQKIIYPIHPRTKKCIEQWSLTIPENVTPIEPVSWLKLMNLVKHAKIILTDSGGLQKEAMWHEKYCLTLRNETEWKETINQGVNRLISKNDTIQFPDMEEGNFLNPYGDGNAAGAISEIIRNYC